MVHKLEIKKVFPLPVITYFGGAFIATIIHASMYQFVYGLAGYALIVGIVEYAKNKANEVN